MATYKMNPALKLIAITFPITSISDILVPMITPTGPITAKSVVSTNLSFDLHPSTYTDCSFATELAL
jgi:hypothetical protein